MLCKHWRDTLVSMKTLILIGGFMFGLSDANAADLKVGQTAPDFSATASDGSVFQLQKAVGQGPIVLYFYPKNDTPGCTKEACGLRDSFAAFRKLNAQVYGISYDTIDSHKEFIEKYRLPFALLSDSDKKISELYDAKGLFGPKRKTYVIDNNGKIAWINPSVSPATHAAELQDVLHKLPK